MTFCAPRQAVLTESLLSVNEEDFCIDPVVRVLQITLSSVFGGILLIMFIVFSMYRHRVKIHTAWNLHPFDRDECEGQGMRYDVFLCCAQGDTHIAREMLDFLESRNYKVCYHLRDFEIGETITNNICQAINGSKRTLCLLSNNFLRSQFCMEEFDIARHREKKRLILVVLELPDHDESKASLFQYLATHTYLEFNCRGFNEKLLYALTVKKLGVQVTITNLDEYSISEDDAGNDEALLNRFSNRIML